MNIKLFKGGVAPAYKTAGAVCADCYARLENKLVIKSGERYLIPLGFAIELPIGYEAVLRPRSGLTAKGIDIGIGTIDWDYRGEIKACIINNSKEDFIIENGDRISQIRIQKAKQFSFTVSDNLSSTMRGVAGFGSTGV